MWRLFSKWCDGRPGFESYLFAVSQFFEMDEGPVPDRLRLWRRIHWQKSSHSTSQGFRLGMASKVGCRCLISGVWRNHYTEINFPGLSLVVLISGLTFLAASVCHRTFWIMWSNTWQNMAILLSTPQLWVSLFLQLEVRIFDIKMGELLNKYWPPWVSRVEHGIHIPFLSVFILCIFINSKVKISQGLRFHMGRNFSCYWLWLILPIHQQILSSNVWVGAALWRSME